MTLLLCNAKEEEFWGVRGYIWRQTHFFALAKAYAFVLNCGEFGNQLPLIVLFVLPLIF
jgi:hypothetical protein